MNINKIYLLLPTLASIVFLSFSAFATSEDESESQNYVVADSIHELDASLSIKDENLNAVEGMLVSVTVGTDTEHLTLVGSPIKTTDADGNVVFVFQASADFVFDGDDIERTVPVQYQTQNETLESEVLVRHADYFSRVEITLYEKDNLIIPAKLMVYNSANQPREGRIYIEGGIRGSVIHAESGANYNQGVLESIYVEEDGVNIWMTMGVSDLAGQYLFRLPGSATNGVADVPGMEKIIVRHDMEASTTAYDTARMADLFDGVDILELSRHTTADQNSVYLPLLPIERRGTVVIAENRTSGYLRLHNLAARYFTAGGANNSTKKCGYNGAFFDGEDWIAFGTTLLPPPSVRDEICEESFVWTE